MSEKKEDVKKAPETEEQQYSLNDDRRVKVPLPAPWWPSGSSATGWPSPDW